MFTATMKLNKCKRLLKVWNHYHFKSVQRNIKKLKEQLWKVEEDSARTGDYVEVAHLRSELSILHDKEEKMWH